MTHNAIASMLAGIGLPYAYDHFGEGEAPGGPPFICFFYTADDDFLSDDSNYQRITGLTVELYTDAPDWSNESAVESAMSGSGLVFSKDGPSYIENERMYQTTWETEVLLDAESTAQEEPSNNTEVLDTDGEQG